MKAKNPILIVAALAVAVAFTSCKKDPEEQVYQSYATVLNPENVKEYTLLSDKGALMKPNNATRPLKDRQRVITNFLIVDEHGDEADYDYDIEYVSLYEILTKGIFNMDLGEVTREEEDSIGHDPFVEVGTPWIASDFLTMEFIVGTSAYSSTPHFLNLVAYADSVPAADGKVHLQFRHNAYNVRPEEDAWSIASFDLLPLKERLADLEEVDIVIHARQYNTSKEITREVTYRMKDAAADTPAPALQGRRPGLETK